LQIPFGLKLKVTLLHRVDMPIGDILKSPQLVKAIAKINFILHQLPNELSAKMKQL